MKQTKRKVKVKRKSATNIVSMRGGLLCQQALDSLGNGNPVAFTKDFGVLTIDLSKELWPGFLVRDLLEQAVSGKLGHFMTNDDTNNVIKENVKIHDSKDHTQAETSAEVEELILTVAGLMTVEEVLMEMAKFDEEEAMKHI